MKTRLTKKGISLLIVLLFFYAISIQAQSGLLFLFTGIILGCFMLNYKEAKRSLKALRVSGLESLKSSENRKFPNALTIRNTSRRPAGMFRLGTAFGELCRAGTIMPLNEHRTMPETVFTKRGIYKFSEIILSSTYPFGLLRRYEKFEEEGRFVVYPFVYECQAPAAAGFEPVTGGGHPGKHRSRTGGEFAGVRTYLPGDSFRAIHWKSSARGQGLMVKEFDEELSGKVALILDCTDYSLPDGESALDRAARAAGSLVFAALDADCHVEFTDMASLEVLHNPAFMDGDQILEKLAAIKPDENCMTKERIAEVVGKLSVKTSISFVITQLNQEFAEAAAALIDARRTVSVYLPENEDAEKLPVGIKVYRYGRESII